MRNFIIKVKIRVSDSWIADGFDIKDRVDQLEEELAAELLPYATRSEIQVKINILSQPDEHIIKGLQDGTIECKD